MFSGKPVSYFTSSGEGESVLSVGTDAAERLRLGNLANVDVSAYISYDPGSIVQCNLIYSRWVVIMAHIGYFA